jgi:NAD(P)-dependent dehydrogenase (short-subunit alcohol dehydrogenase family)
LVEQAGGAGETFECNVRNLEDVKAMADHFIDAWGAVGLLINNAGVADVGEMGKIEMKNWERIIETNLWGAIYGCHVFVPHMKESGGGHIVNTASSAGIASLPQMGPYNVTKAGLISLSETLRSELAPHKIGVTVICPTFFNTNLIKTMTCTSEFEREFTQATFDSAHMSADQVARKVIKAVERKRLYVFPQISAKLNQLSKRFSPGLFYLVIRSLNKLKGREKLFLLLAKLGLFSN